MIIKQKKRKPLSETEIWLKSVVIIYTFISFLSLALLSIKYPSPYNELNIIFNIGMGILAFNLIVSGSIFIVWIMMDHKESSK